MLGLPLRLPWGAGVRSLCTARGRRLWLDLQLRLVVLLAIAPFERLRERLLWRVIDLRPAQDVRALSAIVIKVEAMRIGLLNERSQLVFVLGERSCFHETSILVKCSPA